MLHGDLDSLVSLERNVPGKDFIENDAERIDIALNACLTALDAFRRQIMNRESGVVNGVA